jgi:PEP-CTERM motif
MTLRASALAASLAAATLAVLSGPAAAAASSQTQLSNWSFSLIDLDPNDSVSPTISFSSQQTISSITAGSVSLWDVAYDHSTPTYAEGADSFHSAVARTENGVAQSSGEALGDGTSLRYTAIAQYSMTIDLSPRTGILISADYLASADTSIGGDGLSFESAWSQSILNFAVYVPDGYQTTISVRNHYAGSGWNGSSWIGQSVRQSGVVQLSYANLSDQPVSGYASMVAWSEGYSPFAAAVPEPTTYTMLLAGIAAVAGFARKRRRAEA